MTSPDISQQPPTVLPHSGRVLAAKAIRIDLLSFALHAGAAHDRRDFVGESYWQCRSDETRIDLCEALGQTEDADYWRAYFTARWQ